LNVYGASKWHGEEAVRAANPLHLILRTQWVYAARGKNFLSTMLRLAADKDRLNVVDDQFGAPTHAELIADVTAHAMRGTLAEPSLAGTYHLAARGVTSWHGYARYAIGVARELGWPIRVQDEHIVPVDTSAFPTPARRPHNSRLALERIEQSFDLAIPDWRDGVDRTIRELTNS
jgi:dTDP-4-dehydrorhamnose reductase